MRVETIKKMDLFRSFYVFGDTESLDTAYPTISLTISDSDLLTSSHPKTSKNAIYSIENANNGGLGIDSYDPHQL
jgi:hypothetical protein